ncbi:hypothetical protein DRN34_01460 [Thermococci archaeon]|nr:MAG: hypothetical protein DRN34_01460 [Thermococci archaeon]
MADLEKYQVTDEVLGEMTIGATLSSINAHMPGSVKEIHRVPGGWIYMFTSPNNGDFIHTQFVEATTHPIS